MQARNFLVNYQEHLKLRQLYPKDEELFTPITRLVIALRPFVPLVNQHFTLSLPPRGLRLNLTRGNGKQLPADALVLLQEVVLSHRYNCYTTRTRNRICAKCTHNFSRPCQYFKVLKKKKMIYECPVLLNRNIL